MTAFQTFCRVVMVAIVAGASLVVGAALIGICVCDARDWIAERRARRG